MSTLKQLRQARAAKIEKLNTPEIIADKAAYEALEAEIETDRQAIERGERAERALASLAQPTAGDRGAANAAEIPVAERTLSQVRALAGNRVLRTFDDYLALARTGMAIVPDATKHFRSLGEQLQMIHRATTNSGVAIDPRLVRAPTDAIVTRAPQGASEYDPAGGGFLVQTDFAAAIFMLAHDLGEITQRVNHLPIGPGFNGIKIPGVDETSRATGSRWGGVQSYWVGEGSAPTASRPKFSMREFDLKKLATLMYATDELLADAVALTSVASKAFSEEIMFMTEDAIYEGDGVGKPRGILTAAATVSVAKETGQAATTIVKENIDKMWSRLWARSRRNAVWWINQDIEPQLQSLFQVVGTGGVPVYLPPGGLSAAPFGQLMGRPVIPVEYAATLGTVGDITLGDMSQYTLVDKNGVEVAQSMHVAFTTFEQAFRMAYRVDGMPMWSSALTPFKGSATKSPWVTLATRA